MNLGIDLLPPQCDVLVVGAGPAGSAAAITLARAGVDVVLVDHHAFPREKVCGDGLIPDAHRALRRLGVLDGVMAQFNNAERVKKVAVIGEEWLPDTDVLTPTSKLKRRGINARYAEEIEALYS